MFSTCSIVIMYPAMPTFCPFSFRTSSGSFMPSVYSKPPSVFHVSAS